MAEYTFHCPNCGSNIPEGLTKNEEGYIACPNCGSNLKTDTKYAGAGAEKAGCIGGIIGAIVGLFIGLSIEGETAIPASIFFGSVIGWGITRWIAKEAGG